MILNTKNINLAKFQQQLKSTLTPLAIFFMFATFFIVTPHAKTADIQEALDSVELTPQAEWTAYLKSPTKCKGAYADDAMKVALSSFNEWRQAYNSHKTPPANAFRDAGQSLKYLYSDLQCRDGLVAYRYGNILRLNNKPADGIRVMKSALQDIQKYYPGHLRFTLSSLGQASVTLGLAEDAITYYKAVLQVAPSDSNSRLNLANQLFYQKRYLEAREEIAMAQKYGLSDYGKEVAQKLLNKMP